MNFIHLVLDDHVSFLCAYLPRELQAERPRRQIVESSAVAESAWITDAALSAEQLAEIFDAYRQRLRAFRDQGGSGIGGLGTPDVGSPAPAGVATRDWRRFVTRTVNGTGHTGPSEFCATSI